MRTNSYRGRSYGPNNRARSYGGRSNQNRRRNTKQQIDVNRFIKKAAPVSEQAYTANNKFSDFDLHPSLHDSIASRNFSSPTPIQDQAIQYALDGRDVVGVADTGTGKTAAFLIPLINKLLNNPNQQVLITAPTRELALQIQNEFRQFAKGMKLYSTLCIGGTPIHRQINDLGRNPHVIIGTPGRLKDLIERKKLHLDRCHSIVLDEVDRMVDMGFINDIKAILSNLPANRQSLFLTATIPRSVEAIMHSFLRDPITVTVKTGETANNVDQDILRVTSGNKDEKLHALLKEEAFEKILIFGETKRGVERLSKSLNENGIRSVSIHGNKTQSQRQKALSQFRESNAWVMVATDVAARGLDIKDITHVINYDQPQTYDDYIHRIGRAGRADSPGIALTFVS